MISAKVEQRRHGSKFGEPYWSFIWLAFTSKHLNRWLLGSIYAASVNHIP